MYSVLNTLSEYTHFNVSKNITCFTKSLKAFSISLKKIAKDLQINTSDITLTYQSKWKKESKGESNRENKKMDERRCAEKNQMPHYA